MNLYKTSLKLTIAALSDPSNPAASDKGEVFGELTSASISFQLNSIPTASVSAPLGAKIVGGGKFETSYAYKTPIQSAYVNRTPVGIYLETSEETPGVPKGSLCLFRGYIVSEVVDAGVGSASLQLTVAHWLCDLAVFPILHRLSSPENTADLSMDSVFNSSLPSGRDTMTNLARTAWTPAKAFADTLNDEEALNVFEAIRAGLKAALGESKDLKETDPGYTSKELYQKVENALAGIESKYLEFSSGLNANGELVRSAIANALIAQTSDAYYSVTLWQKLIQTLLPAFYVCVIPGVDKAMAVPTPGIHMTIDRAREVGLDSIISVRMQTGGGQLLGGVFLAARSGIHTNGLSSSTRLATSFQYPSPAKPGVLKACYLPAWLESYIAVSDTLRLKAVPNFGFVMKDAAQQAVGPTNDSPGVRKLCEAFIKSVYAAEVTKSNAATLVTPLRLDIVPGDVLQVEMPRDESTGSLDTDYFYGTVQTVSYSISENTVQTVFSLTNIRSEKQMNDMKSYGALLYEKGWRDKADTTFNLYIKED